MMADQSLTAGRQDTEQEQPVQVHRTGDVYHDRAALLETVRQGDVRLIRGDYLVKLDARKEKVPRHQDLPEEAFMTFEELQSEEVEIVAISYCWSSKGHPDPHRFHLPLIASMVKATMAGKLVSGYEYFRVAGWRFGAAAVAVLWDFLCLPQEKRNESEKAIFKRGLASMNAWYGSVHVTKWILLDLPEGAERASYQTSGWTRFELEVANLISPPWRMLTLARGNAAHRQLLYFEAVGFKANSFIEISYDAFHAGRRKGPMVPDDFDTCLDTLTFTNGTDRDTVIPKYREAFNILVQGATMMSFSGYDLTHEEAEKALTVALAHCPNMEQLDMAYNEQWKADIGSIAERVAAAPCSGHMTRLDFADCLELCGDVGCFSALTNLQSLNLHRDEGVFGDVKGLAPLVNLHTLHLGITKVSGDVSGLAPLVHLRMLLLLHTKVRGDVEDFAPLARLEKLDLCNTEVTGNVMAFAPLSNLKFLDISSTKVTGNSAPLRRQLPELQLHCIGSDVTDDVNDVIPTPNNEEPDVNGVITSPRPPGDRQSCACTIA